MVRIVYLKIRHWIELYMLDKEINKVAKKLDMDKQKAAIGTADRFL